MNRFPFAAATLVLVASASAHSAPTKPVKNGFDLYLAASKMIVSAEPTVDPIDDGSPPTDSKERAERYSLARRQAWLNKNAAGFALFQKALKTPSRHRDMMSVAATFPSYASLRQLARDKGIERNTREMMGDWNGAMQSRLDIVQMGDDVSRGGPLIASLVGIAIQAIGRNEPWEATEHLSLPQTRAAAARLEGIYARRVRFAQTLEEEKRYGLAQIDEVVRQPNWRDPKGWGEDMTPAEKLQLLSITPDEMRRTYVQSMTQQIEQAQLPYASRDKAPERKRDLMSALLTPNWMRVGFSAARAETGNAVWLVTLALRAYKLERGAYPENLRALVPGFLRNVPSDPFGGGEALRYKRTGETYVLWSIGPDGVDNGGRAVTNKRPRILAPGQKPRLPFLDTESKGDYGALHYKLGLLRAEKPPGFWKRLFK